MHITVFLKFMMGLQGEAAHLLAPVEGHQGCSAKTQLDSQIMNGFKTMIS